MKKAIVYRNDIYPEAICGDAAYELYFGIDTLEGGWMITTEGDPNTAYDFDEKEGWQDAQKEKAAIEAIIADPRTPLEEITDEDIEYVNEWLGIWGCEPIE